VELCVGSQLDRMAGVQSAEGSDLEQGNLKNGQTKIEWRAVGYGCLTSFGSALVMIVLLFGFAFATGYFSFHPPYKHYAQMPFGVTIIVFILGLLIDVLSGYVTARCSRTAVTVNVLTLGVIMMLIGSYGVLSPTDNAISDVLRWISWYLTIPIIFVGARLTRKDIAMS
jgi:hypothetical protein